VKLELAVKTLIACSLFSSLVGCLPQTEPVIARPTNTITPTITDTLSPPPPATATATPLSPTDTNTPQIVSQYRPAFLLENIPGPFQSRIGLEPTIISVDTGDERISYRFEYDLPQNEQNQFSGFVVFSDEPTNIADYKYMRVVVTFGDPEAKCQLILRDFGINWVDKNDDNLRYIRLDASLTTLGSKIEINGNTYTFLIPISSLASSLAPINLKEIRQIGFQANSNFTTGKHLVIIEDISFTDNE
jgi:hypothetical protein